MATHRTLTATLLVRIQSRLPETYKVLRSLTELVRNISGSEVLKNGKSSCSKWSEMNSLINIYLEEYSSWLKRTHC